MVFAGGAFEASGPITTSRAFTGSGSNPISLTVDSGAALTLNGIVGGSGNSSGLTASGLGTVYELTPATIIPVERPSTER